MEISRRDYRELHNFAEGASNIGERFGDWIDKYSRKITRKMIIILSSILIGVIFFSLGLFWRKK